MTPCDTCNFIGPDLDVVADRRDRHRAAHDLLRSLAEALAPLERLTLWLLRVTRRAAP